MFDEAAVTTGGQTRLVAQAWLGAPPRIGTLAKACIGLSIVVAALVVIALGTAAVIVLAHHVSPVGGGG